MQQPSCLGNFDHWEVSMAVPRPIPFDHSLVFPHRAQLVAEIAPARDFNMST